MAFNIVLIGRVQVRKRLFITKATSSFLFHFTQHNNFARACGKCSRQSILQEQSCDSYSGTTKQQQYELYQIIINIKLYCKVKSASSQAAHQTRALILVSVTWNNWGHFYSPLDGMLVHRKVTSSIKFVSTHLYTWVERGTVRVKRLAQEHNTMSPGRIWTQTARSVDERTNHEATTPPTMLYCTCQNFFNLMQEICVFYFLIPWFSKMTKDQKHKPPLPNKLLFLIKDHCQRLTVYNLP